MKHCSTNVSRESNVWKVMCRMLRDNGKSKFSMKINQMYSTIEEVSRLEDTYVNIYSLGNEYLFVVDVSLLVVCVSSLERYDLWKENCFYRFVFSYAFAH